MKRQRCGENFSKLHPEAKLMNKIILFTLSHFPEGIFFQYWGLILDPHDCKAGAQQLEPFHQTIFCVGYF
jgi:hypothetical protein